MFLFFLNYKMSVLLILLIFIVLICCLGYMASKDGSAELVENKVLLKSKVQKLGYANFTSFLEKKKLKSRLICITGAKNSGRMFLAEQISKKYGHKIIQQGDRDIPKIRQEFYIEGEKSDMSPAEKSRVKENIKREKNKKYVIVGHFDDDDLARLFKGKNYNRNFLLLFVWPKNGLGLRWSKLTGKEKSEYDNVIAETDKLLARLKKYRVYGIPNDFND